MCDVKLRARAVFPTDVRAPTTTNCPGRNPPVISSSEGNPVINPARVFVVSRSYIRRVFELPTAIGRLQQQGNYKVFAVEVPAVAIALVRYLIGECKVWASTQIQAGSAHDTADELS